MNIAETVKNTYPMVVNVLVQEVGIVKNTRKQVKKMKAIKITTDNVISVVTVPEPTWKGMGQLVGGYFEHVRPHGFVNLDVPEKENLCMIVNGEGRIIGLELNDVGSHLYNDLPCHKGFDFEPVVGDILILTEGFVHGEPDIVGLSDEQLIIVRIALKEKFDYLMEVTEEGEE